MSDWAIFGASVAFLAASIGAFRHFRRPRVDEATEFALKFAVVDAMQRGHESTSIDHLAFALTFDPDVAARLRAAGREAASIRRQIDEHLGTLEGPGKPVPAPRVDDDVGVVLRSTLSARLLSRPSHLLREIAQGPACFAKALLPPPEGFDQGESPKRTLVDCDVEPSSAYRADRGLTVEDLVGAKNG